MKILKSRANLNKSLFAKVNIDMKASKVFHDVCIGGW